MSEASPVDEIWKSDVLKRRLDATYLQKYLASRYLSKPSEPGFVLAINAEWGHGKSFMLQRWKDEVTHQGFPAIYFDAWQNDFTTEPLLAFIAELEEGLTQYFKKIPLAAATKRKVLRSLSRVWKPALTIIASSAAKHLAGMSVEKIVEVVHDVNRENQHDEDVTPAAGIKEVSVKAGEELKKALEPHKTVKTAIKAFKENLKILTDHLDTVQQINLPILIFVDELDRCRPDYAIQLLEGIKHLFGVRGVNFIIATNISQLSESVRAIYGANFDGSRYLQRFFDLQYALPRPDNLSFSTLMLADITLPKLENLAYGLDEQNTLRPPNQIPQTSVGVVGFILAKHAEAYSLSLRDIAQVTTILEAAFFTLRDKRVHVFFLVFLAVIYQRNVQIFRGISTSRKIDKSSGIESIEAGGLAGGIPVVAATDDYGNFRSMKVVTPKDVAIVYLSNLHRSPTEQRHGMFFPENIFNHNDFYSDQSRNSINYQAKFVAYFSIVEQAGGFSETGE